MARCAPCRSKASARCEPMKPAPPVRRTLKPRLPTHAPKNIYIWSKKVIIHCIYERPHSKDRLATDNLNVPVYYSTYRVRPQFLKKYTNIRRRCQNARSHRCGFTPE